MQNNKENRNAQTNDNNGTPIRAHARRIFLKIGSLTARFNTLQIVYKQDLVLNTIAISSQGADPLP